MRETISDLSRSELNKYVPFCQNKTTQNNLKFLQCVSIIQREVGVMQQHVDGVVCVVAVPEELH